MDFRLILENSIKAQKAILEKARGENRAVTEEKTTEISNLQTKIDDAKKMIDLENSIAQNTQHVVDVQATDEAREGSLPPANVVVKNNPPLFRNGMGSVYQLAKDLAYGKQIDQKYYNAADGMNELIPDEGGFLVKTTEGNTLIQRTYDTAILAPKCMRIKIDGNSYSQPYLKETSRVDGSRWGGTLAYWGEEAGTYTASQPKFGKIKMDLEKLYSFMYATDEMLEDASALESQANNWVTQELAFKLDEAIYEGNGAGKPQGAMSSNCKVEVPKETSQSADTIVFENVSKMRMRLWSRSRNNAAFYINQDIEHELDTMAFPIGTGGVPVYLPATGINGSRYSTLYGMPVIPLEHCETLGTTGDIMLADFSQFMLIEKAVNPIRSDSSIHVKFETGQKAFRTTYRVNGQMSWQSALTPKKGTNTQSPVVTLATR